MQDTTIHIAQEQARALLSRVAKMDGLSKGGVSIARFAGLTADGCFLVWLSEDESASVPALSTVALQECDTRSEVVIAFERGRSGQPVILGKLKTTAPTPPPTLRIDAERLLLEAERDIELRCGEASIILTSAGKILIRGNYVVSRSRGANKIKGAFVDIN